MAIKQEAERLMATNKGYRAFGQPIVKLAAEFDDGAIARLVEKYLNG
jgi:hypothetical protein